MVDNYAERRTSNMAKKPATPAKPGEAEKAVAANR